ncbi:hypothetical protein HYV11_01040 [Candidatus Dependentiae bacterium]|nr:hypothetical protein [Candidatus Dependentiae bacterium]
MIEKLEHCIRCYLNYKIDYIRLFCFSISLLNAYVLECPVSINKPKIDSLPDIAKVHIDFSLEDACAPTWSDYFFFAAIPSNQEEYFCFRNYSDIDTFLCNIDNSREAIDFFLVFYSSDYSSLAGLPLFERYFNSLNRIDSSLREGFHINTNFSSSSR